MSGYGQSGRIEDLDAAAACAAIADTHRDRVAVECRQLELAAHWIDLHAPEDHPDAEPVRVLPGTERSVRVGADGTPLISEFAAAEFAALQDMHPLAGGRLLRKVANLRHRHPLLWARVRAGEVPAWKALETARIVGRDTPDQPGLCLKLAHWVDAQTHAWIDLLPWGQFLDLVDKKIIEADPKSAAARRAEAETTQFVATGRSNAHGLKMFFAKAQAGEVIYLVAVIDRLADVLALRGDGRPLGQRRAAALGILAHPAHALELLAYGTVANAHPEDPADEETLPSDPVDDQRMSDAPTDEAPTEAEPTDQGLGGQGAAEDESEPPSYLRLPEGIRQALEQLRGIGTSGLLPNAVLYVHLDGTRFLDTGAIDPRTNGVAEVEDLGIVLLDAVQEWLGHHRVTVKPILDPSIEPPTDAYVFPPRLREAVHLQTRRDVFPHAGNSGRRKDIDHPDPYVPPRSGGPPGQTGLHNAAPMSRHHHRLKTHGRWGIRQLAPGVYLWTSPHGYPWLTDNTGTRPIPKEAAELIHHALEARTDHAA